MAVAKRGALTQKKAIVAAKNRMSATVAGRIVTACGPSEEVGRGALCRGPQRGGDYQRWEGWIVPTLSLVAMT